ncbi:MAG TPA: hypothetical protein VM509_02125, partial [Planctomycetota bacterium]|nr:hypothetical protein [Planctomycetota bacterium]
MDAEPNRKASRKMDNHKEGQLATAHAQELDSVREQKLLLQALQAMRDGNFDIRMPGDWTGMNGKIADTFNEIVSANAHLARELDRVGQSLGKQGHTAQRVRCDQRRGKWGEMENSVNSLIDDLLWP